MEYKLNVKNVDHIFNSVDRRFKRFWPIDYDAADAACDPVRKWARDAARGSGGLNQLMTPGCDDYYWAIHGSAVAQKAAIVEKMTSRALKVSDVNISDDESNVVEIGRR